jgi:hypothetical protein
MILVAVSESCECFAVNSTVPIPKYLHADLVVVYRVERGGPWSVRFEPALVVCDAAEVSRDPWEKSCYVLHVRIVQ